MSLGADIYLACVAKDQLGIDKSYPKYSEIARKHSMDVLMVNSLGRCDNFLSVGQSAVWNQNGEMIESLEAATEELLLYDNF